MSEEMLKVFCRGKMPEVYAWKHLLQIHLGRMGQMNKGLILLETLTEDETKERSSNTDCGVCLLFEVLALVVLLLLN